MSEFHSYAIDNSEVLEPHSLEGSDACPYVCVCHGLRMCVCSRACVCVCVNVRACLRACVPARVCVCMYMCIYIYIIYIYIYMWPRLVKGGGRFRDPWKQLHESCTTGARQFVQS